MPCPCDATGLRHTCALSWVCGKKKSHIEKNRCNPQCFQGINYKAKFSTSLILKKINKDNFEKNHNKKKRKEKKNMQGNTVAIYSVS